MPRPPSFDPAAIDALLRATDGIATHSQLLQAGLHRRTTSRWARSGPWQRVLPGVIANHRAPLSRRERRLAAVAYCGQGAVISGEHALDLLAITGNRITVSDQVLVLIPWSQKRLSVDFVTVERTRRPPTTSRRQGLLVAGPARAAADAARHGADLDRTREVFGAVLHQGRCTLEELRREVYEGPNQRSGDARRVLAEVSAGTRSAGEAKIRTLIVASALPQPLWNQLVVIDGVRVGEADAWWPDLGVALEVDSIRWHSTPADIRRTQAKQRRYARAGVVLVSIAPADALADPTGFLQDLAQTLAAAQRRAPRRGTVTPR
ncbi:hypothetical protein ACFEMC_09085 [Kineococcus sp. DHX-1]|uniref:hypothetical protein n=1 Tax=Kineococcus sp. DHX-1 TaxID=3349638 RepID=UPI0036D2FB05